MSIFTVKGKKSCFSIVGQLSSSFPVSEIELHSLVYKINRKDDNMWRFSALSFSFQSVQPDAASPMHVSCPHQQCSFMII